jgi:hypothetical protein
MKCSAWRRADDRASRCVDTPRTRGSDGVVPSPFSPNLHSHRIHSSSSILRPSSAATAQTLAAVASVDLLPVITIFLPVLGFKPRRHAASTRLLCWLGDEGSRGGGAADWRRRRGWRGGDWRRKRGGWLGGRGETRRPIGEVGFRPAFIHSQKKQMFCDTDEKLLLWLQLAPLSCVPTCH